VNLDKPKQELTLFLRRAHSRPEVEKYTPTGIPQGEPLYSLTSPQGMLISTGEGLYTQPLSDLPLLLEDRHDKSHPTRPGATYLCFSDLVLTAPEVELARFGGQIRLLESARCVGLELDRRNVVEV
jgi:hypothetical protein